MRNKQKHSSQEEAEVDLTPMLDIVFIMLIFFIVTAVFVKEPGVDVVRPTAATAIPVKSVAILIAVTADSEIYIDKKEVDKDSVKTTVERMLAENPNGDVVIQADEDSEIDVVVEVMDQVQMAGAQRVHIAALEEK